MEVLSTQNTLLFNLSFQSEVNVFFQKYKPPLFLRSFLIHLSAQLIMLGCMNIRHTWPWSCQRTQQTLISPHCKEHVIELSGSVFLSECVKRFARRLLFQVLPTYRQVSKYIKRILTLFSGYKYYPNNQLSQVWKYCFQFSSLHNIKSQILKAFGDTIWIQVPNNFQAEFLYFCPDSLFSTNLFPIKYNNNILFKLEQYIKKQFIM